MKTIETKEQLIQWAQEINRGLTTKQKCDYQDIFAHSAMDDIKRFFIESNGERNIILCSIFNTMAYDTVEMLLKHWAKVKAQNILDKEMEYVNAESINKLKILAVKENELTIGINTFEACKKPIYKRLASMTRELKVLRDKAEVTFENNCELTKENRDLRHALKAAQEKGFKYDTIKALLQ